MEKEREDRALQVVCHRAGGETRELELQGEKESEDCLPDSRSPWPVGFQRERLTWMLASKIRDWVKKGGCRRVLAQFRGSGPERKERAHQVVYYRAGFKAGELELEDKKESSSSLPGSLASLDSRLLGRDSTQLLLLWATLKFSKCFLIMF